MENISHSVVGMALGEVVHRTLKAEPCDKDNSIRRNLFVFTSLLCANFPDIDIVLTNLLPEPIGYLLHHRGHTHTFFYLIPQALFLFFVIPLFWKSSRELLKKSKTARYGFKLSIALGLLSHIALDSLNSYGIHPLHPIDNSWYYGDLIFIIEPIFWILLGLPLLALFKSRLTKWAWTSFLYIVPLVLTGLGYLNFAWVACSLIIGSVLMLIQTKTHRAWSVLVSFLLCVGFVFVQVDGRAKAQGVYELSLAESGKVNVDLSLNPMPTQRDCWMFVGLDKIGPNIQTTRGVLSLSGNINNCPSGFLNISPTKESRPNLLLYSVDSVPAIDLKRLYKENCFFRAWTRFARAPIVQESRAWDGRFQRGTKVENFSLIDFNNLNNTSCPDSLPPWTEPRRELLI